MSLIAIASAERVELGEAEPGAKRKGSSVTAPPARLTQPVELLALRRGARGASASAARERGAGAAVGGLAGARASRSSSAAEKRSRVEAVDEDRVDARSRPSPSQLALERRRTR